MNVFSSILYLLCGKDPKRAYPAIRTFPIRAPFMMASHKRMADITYPKRQACKVWPARIHLGSISESSLYVYFASCTINSHSTIRISLHSHPSVTEPLHHPLTW